MKVLDAQSASELRAREREARLARLRAHCAALGISIERHGRGWRLRGPGVDLTVVDLAMVRADDLGERPSPSRTAARF